LLKLTPTIRFSLAKKELQGRQLLFVTQLVASSKLSERRGGRTVKNTSSYQESEGVGAR